MTEDEKEEKELWQKIASETGEAKVDALIKLSYRAYYKGENEECLALCETAREEYEAIGAEASSATLAHIYYGIACSQQRLKNHHEAIAAVEKSASIFKEMGSAEVIPMLKFQGDLWFDMKEYQKAYETFQLIPLEGGPSISDSDLAWAYDSSAQSLAKMEKWGPALESYKQAQELYKKLKAFHMMAHVYEEISLCYSNLENGVEAEAYANLALDIAVTAEDDYHLMWSKARKALAYKILGNYDEALDLFAQAKSALVHTDSVD